jgi:hypothetical protein
MSIKVLVGDAEYLATAGRKLGALSVLLIAVAGSSRKVFPRKTAQSVTKPGEKMGDGEAFKLFLGGRLRKCLFTQQYGPDIPGASGLVLGYKGNNHSIEFLIYKHYRNGLIHEAELPQGIEFDDSPYDPTQPLHTHVQFECHDNRLRLASGWIRLLIKVVSHARCNAKEFGFRYFDLAPRGRVDEAALRAACVAETGVSAGRFDAIRGVFHVPENLAAVSGSDDEVRTWFKSLYESNGIHGGVVRGLARANLSDGSGTLNTAGIAFVRRIAAAYELVEA